MEKETRPLLEVDGLSVEYSSSGQTVYAVNNVSFALNAGETLGLVGETGAGKTSIAKAILRILPDHSTKKCSGRICFDGQELISLSEEEMQHVRGRKISMIFQDPMTALNPVKKVVDQIAEPIRVHQKADKKLARQKAIEMLRMVGISEDRADEYPHQFSGGMKQRVVIALALACRPELLIADEPTTALDVTIQAQVLDLIANLKERMNSSMLLITHDLGVVGEVCDKVAVIYAGEIVECADKLELFTNPVHPYTKGLFGALPDLSKSVRRLSPIDGLPPDPTVIQSGCAFYPRCPLATEACAQAKVRLSQVKPGHTARCIHLMHGEGND